MTAASSVSSESMSGGSSHYISHDVDECRHVNIYGIFIANLRKKVGLNIWTRAIADFVFEQLTMIVSPFGTKRKEAYIPEVIVLKIEVSCLPKE